MINSWNEQTTFKELIGLKWFYFVNSKIMLFLRNPKGHLYWMIRGFIFKHDKQCRSCSVVHECYDSAKKRPYECRSKNFLERMQIRYRINKKRKLDEWYVLYQKEQKELDRKIAELIEG